MGFIQNFLLGIRKQDKWYHQLIYKTVFKLRILRLPFPKFFGALYFYERRMRITVWNRMKQFFYYEPMFRFSCTEVGNGLYIESNCPIITGYGSVFIGNRVRFSGNVSFAVAYKVNPNPTISIGNDVYIGYASCFSCADKITLGNNILIAAGVQIYDNNNHPIDPEARFKNLPVEEENISPVKIEDNVWIGSNAVILKGVTIGKGSVVALSSIVTKDVPPMSVVAGNPARIIKKIISIKNNIKITKDNEMITRQDSDVTRHDRNEKD